MGQILIRNVEPRVLDALRQRAAAQGRSLEEEARRALTAAAGLDKAEALARFDAVRAAITLGPGPDSLDDLRTDRQRDT